LKNEARLLVEDLVKRTKPKKGEQGKLIKYVINEGFSDSVMGASSVPMPDYYRQRSQFGSKGQLKKRQAGRPSLAGKILIQKSALAAFIKKQQSHIGRFASGWIGKGNPLKATRVPAYIQRHVDAGIVLIKFQGVLSTVIKGANFSGSWAKHIPRFNHRIAKILNAALASRAWDMRKKLHYEDIATKYKLPKSK
jgi:hypothetical protein